MQGRSRSIILGSGKRYKTSKPGNRVQGNRSNKNTRVDLTRQTGNRQTENTGLNTQEVMGTNGRHLVGGGDRHKTGETDQGVIHTQGM